VTGADLPIRSYQLRRRRPNPGMLATKRTAASPGRNINIRSTMTVLLMLCIVHRQRPPPAGRARTAACESTEAQPLTAKQVDRRIANMASSDPC
jgi:hypothetical protein